LLREAEMWSVAAFGGREADGYPAAQLERLWRTILVLQFHDILPGSSIAWVHREAEATHAACAAELEGLIAEALTALAGADALVVNAAPHARDEVVVVDPVAGTDLATLEGVQTLSDGRLAFRTAVPALGLAPLAPRPLDEPVAVWDGEAPATLVLDNGVLRVTLDADGCVTSLRHLRSGRETLAAGARGGLLQLHHDLPFEYDAWDIEEYYRRRVTDLDGPATIEVLERGPAVARVRVTRAFRASRAVLTYELRAGSPRVDVGVELDWHERDHLLKVSWPVDVHTGDVARHIQYGHVRTPIHTNTSWDHARFEVCAHQWIDVGEPGFGVALLSDSRYGYDVTRTRGDDGASSTTMRLTAVKGPRFPDPLADEGHHAFTMSVMPHAGKFRKEGVVAEGYRLEVPVRVVGPVASDDAVVPEPVVAVDHDAVVVEAVKAAEDGSGDLVVRAYESFGGRATTLVRFDREVLDVRATDFLEEDAPPAPAPGVELVDVRTARLTLRPFQIATLRAVVPPH
jgi:alpha-mannosidase